MRLVPAVLSAFILSGVLACAAPARGVPRGVPAFEITSPGGIHSVLIGSLHEPAAGLVQPAPEVLDGARLFVVEQVKEPPVASSGTEFDPGALSRASSRAAWAMNLSETKVSELKQRARCLPGLSSEDQTKTDLLIDLLMKYRRPEMLASVAIYRCGPAGLLARDELMARAAAARHLTPLPLESQASVTAQRDAVSDRIYLELIQGSFEPAAASAVPRTVRALNDGDFDTLASIMGELLPAADASAYYETMVAARNRAWMPVLTRYLDQGPAVVLVGAYHLPGPDGLIALLKAKGYGVKAKVLPAGPAG